MSRETPVQHFAALSRPGVTPSGKRGIGGRVGKRVSERSPEGCSAQRSHASRKSSLRVFHPRRLPRRPFERWLTSLFRRAHSARRRAAPVLQLTTVQSPTKHPSGFPSGTLAYSRTNIRHPGCNTSCPERRGLPIPICSSATQRGRGWMGLTMSRKFLLYMSCCNDVYRKLKHKKGRLLDTQT